MLHKSEALSVGLWAETFLESEQKQAVGEEEEGAEAAAEAVWLRLAQSKHPSSVNSKQYQ